jgi:ATP-dependent RNA helicase DeaD
MWREGVAYTFVTPEEGPELTRIEMRIERLLKRDEMPGFEAFAKPAGAAANAAGEGAATGEGGAAAEGTPATKPKAPLYGRDGRPVRRIRRAL